MGTKKPELFEMNREASRNNEGIIRQSQLQRAIELFQLFDKKPSLREVLRLSQILTDFQYNWNLNTYEILLFEKHFKQETNLNLIASAPHINTDNQLQGDKTKGVSEYQTQIAKKLKGKE